MNSDRRHRGEPVDPIGSVRKAQVQELTNERDTSENGNIALVKRCYETERSFWESRKEGRRVVYSAPTTHDGDQQPTAKGEQMVSPENRKSQWLALATWCAERRIEPTAFIRVVFEHVPLDLKLPPEPAQLRSEKYLAIWNKFFPRLLETMAMKLEIEKRAVTAEIASYQVLDAKKEDSFAAALMDRSVKISPLMRYCLAISIGGSRFQKIATVFEREAIFQFIRYQTEYRRVWKELLPEGFAALATRSYPQLLEKLI